MGRRNIIRSAVVLAAIAFAPFARAAEFDWNGTVSIAHVDGAKVSLTPKADETVQYDWKGTAGSFTAILKIGQ